MRKRFLLACLVAAAAVAVLAPLIVPGRLTVVITAVLYFPIVLGISALAGYAKQISGGHATFFGTGAYVTGSLSASGISPWFSMLMGVSASVVIGVIIALPVMRLRGHFLVLATIAVNIIFVVLLRQWKGLTGGSSGLLGIKPLEIFGQPLTDYKTFLYMALAWAVIAAVGTYNIVNSVPGRALKALGASEAAATSVGISQTNYSVFLFCWSTLLAGGSGALYAEWARFLSPATFDIHLSITLLMMAVIGGVGSIGGAALGVVIYMAMTEIISELLGPTLGSDSPIVEGIVFGALLLVLIILRPSGIASFFRKKRKTSGPRLTEPTGRPHVAPAPPSRSLDDPGLSVRDISQQFGGIVVLEGISLDAARGEVVALVGPNGAGKSTLLNIISGLLKPSGGTVSFGGEALSGLSPNKVAHHGIRRSFQTPQLVPEMRVLDNVAIGMHREYSGPVSTLRAMLGLNVRDEQDIAYRSAESLKETESSGTDPSAAVDSLPFGDRRWVEMARTTVSGPELILLDEPASGLTHEERDQLVRLVRGYAEAGAVVLLVEHDMDLVRKVSDRTVVLHRGGVLAHGPTEQTLGDSRVQEAYLGSANEDSHLQRGPRDSGEVLLEVRELETGYGNLSVVDSASFDVRAGEVTALLGPNGAGKTTILKGITGQLPIQGEVNMCGVRANGHQVDELARRGLVLVPEGRELIPGFTVFEHLRLSRWNSAVPEDGEHFDLDAVYDLFPVLSERAGQIATSLSGGQQQMLALARALLMQPRVLLVDEPLLGLAPLAVQEVLTTLRTLADRGLAVVLAEQQARTVLPFVDKVLHVDQGVVTSEIGGEAIA